MYLQPCAKRGDWPSQGQNMQQQDPAASSSSLTCMESRLPQKLSASRSLNPISALGCRPKATALSAGIVSLMYSSTCRGPQRSSYHTLSHGCLVACSVTASAAHAARDQFCDSLDGETVAAPGVALHPALTWTWVNVGGGVLKPGKSCMPSSSASLKYLLR